MSTQEYFEKVRDIVLDQHNVSTANFMSHRRARKFVYARAQWLYLVKPVCEKSEAAVFLGRERTTIYNLEQVHEIAYAQDLNYRYLLSLVQSLLPDQPQLPLPVRVQWRRTRGWRKPENTIYCGRPSKWGNPFRAQEGTDARFKKSAVAHEAIADAVAKFEAYVVSDPRFCHRIRTELRGKNLGCWCAANQPCHVDVLLRIANTPV